MPEPRPLPDTANASAETYGAYRVVRPLGEGASGRVFLAERTDFAQRVALKVFRPEFLTGLTGTGSAREAHLLTSLDHRNIVRVLHEGVTPEGVRFLAMEYVEGDDLLHHANTRRLPLKDRVRLLLQVLDAVSYAHRHLVLHGDLKPANILVTAEGEVRLVDFGSAVPLAATAAREDESTGHTPDFASPEQQAGARPTAASDIYSLGLIARLLFADASAEQSAALRGDLHAVLQKALHARPEERYPTAEAMAADLRAYLDGRTPSVRKAPFAERVRKWVLRHRLGAAMTALLLAAIVFSVAGVAIKAAQARRSRREAQARLHELVALTGTLQSELYGSVRVLPNAAAPEKLLTDAVAATLDRLAASGAPDPTLRNELALQYAQLARLELEQARDAALPGGAVPEAVVRHLSASLALTDPHDPQWPERKQSLDAMRARRGGALQPIH